jgi:superoxide reductase
MIADNIKYKFYTKKEKCVMSFSRFYLCKHCGNMVGIIESSGVPMVCCGEEMILLEPNTVDASHEKHVPSVVVDGDMVKVQIGEVLHPMTEAHYIKWVYLQTEKGGQRKGFNPGEEPVATFRLVDDKPVAVFAYCNLHGLWVKEIK